jgi:hypothetical protein
MGHGRLIRAFYPILLGRLAPATDVQLGKLDDVGFGSGADIAGALRHVRFTLENGRRTPASRDSNCGGYRLCSPTVAAQ